MRNLVRLGSSVLVSRALTEQCHLQRIGRRGIRFGKTWLNIKR